MTLPASVAPLDADLNAIFADRLQSIVAYESAERGRDAMRQTLAVVDALTPADLRACADRVATWHVAGLATPLLLEAAEFGRSLDAFPFEFGAILAEHVVVWGHDPFEGLHVHPDDIRRACEVQARSHLLHLREGYIETQGRSDALADLVLRSAGPLAALLRNVERLGAGHPDPVLAKIAELGDMPLSSDEAKRMFPAYLSAVEHMTNTIDRWNRT